MQASSSLMAWNVLTWHGGGVCLNMPLTNDCYVTLLHNLLHSFMGSINPNNNGLLQQGKLPQIGFWSILA